MVLSERVDSIMPLIGKVVAAGFFPFKSNRWRNKCDPNKLSSISLSHIYTAVHGAHYDVTIGNCLSQGVTYHSTVTPNSLDNKCFS